ncbi:MAG: tetratricopeptide repeat protein [Planctomycetota bacterium]
MADPITLGTIGAFVGTSAASFVINVASSHYHDHHKPWQGYENHDIPRCVAKAWGYAFRSVAKSYRSSHKSELNDADRSAIDAAVKDLTSNACAEAMFIGNTGAQPPWAADLHANPLAVTTEQTRRDEASRKLAQMLREYANGKPLLSKVPDSFFSHCEEQLFDAVSYFYVEIAIKSDDKARSQIMYEIASGMWTQLGELRETADQQSAAIDRIESQVRRSADREHTLTQTNATLAGLVADRQARIDELEDAYRRLAQERLREGRTADEIIAELKGTSYDELIEALETESVDAAKEARQAIERAVGLCRAVVVLAFPRGEIQRAEEQLRALLTLAPDDLDAITRMGHLLMLRGDLAGASERYTHVLKRSQTKGGQAAALGNLGVIELTRGNLDAAERYQSRSLALMKELGHKEGMANNLGNLGVIERMRGNLDAAADYHERSLAIEQELGRKEGIATDLGNLGLIELTRGNLNAAERYHSRSLALMKELGQKEGMANSLGNLGVIERMRGNLDAAADYHERSLAIEKELNRKGGIASDLGNLGLVEFMRGNLDAAEDYYNRSLLINEELGRKEGMANQLANLGSIAKKCGDFRLARERWTRALELFAEIGMLPQVEQVKQLLDSLPADG